MYAQITKVLEKFISRKNIYKYGFNFSPMYKRSTGKVISVSDNLHEVTVRIKLSYKNSNYVGSIFGGSMLSATDPIFMIQLLNILGDDFVVWDKEASIKFKRPAKETCYVDFIFTEQEIEDIKQKVSQEKEIDVVKDLQIVSADKSKTFATLTKVIYVADKNYYKEKRKRRKAA